MSRIKYQGDRGGEDEEELGERQKGENQDA